MKRWRVGILGLGHWYSAYGLARALRDYPKATLVGAAWPVRAELDEFSSTFGIQGHEDYGALIERDDVDIVHIAAPVCDIAELTIRAARAGKHLIVGKPMAMTMAQAARMVEAVDEAGVVCFPMQGLTRLRYQRLKERLDRGLIGDIVVLHQTARWSIAEHWPRAGAPGWFADPAQVPGGAFIDEGIYWIDFFRWLTGSEVTEVDGRIANLVHPGLAVEDWGFASFLFANGVRATLEAAWTITVPRVSGPSPKQNSVVRLEVIGTRGEVTDQWFRSPGMALLTPEADDWRYERQSEDLFTPALPLPLAHLIECLETGRTPIATLHDARTSLGVALDVYESARPGRQVRRVP